MNEGSQQYPKEIRLEELNDEIGRATDIEGFHISFMANDPGNENNPPTYEIYLGKDGRNFIVDLYEVDDGLIAGLFEALPRLVEEANGSLESLRDLVQNQVSQ